MNTLSSTFNPVNNDKAYETAKAQADQGTSVTKLVLDEVGKYNTPFTAPQRNPWESVPNVGGMRALSHPSFVVMPALRLIDIMIRRIQLIVIELRKKVEDLLSSQSNLSDRIQKMGTEHDTLKSNLTSTSTRVDQLAQRLDSTENSGYLEKRVQDLEEKNQQLRQENARKNEEHERRLAEVEQRHAEQIRKLELAVSSLTSRHDGSSTPANSLNSLSDDESENEF